MIDIAYESFVNDIFLEAIDMNRTTASKISEEFIDDKVLMETIDGDIKNRLILEYKDPLKIIYGKYHSEKFTGRAPMVNDFEVTGYGSGCDDKTNMPQLEIYYELTDKYANYLANYINNKEKKISYSAKEIKDFACALVIYDPLRFEISNIMFGD